MIRMASTSVTKARPYYDRIVSKLTDSLRPVQLSVIDESHKHKGHAGNPGTGETHFRVEIVSQDFENMRLLDRHRKVYEILDSEIKEQVHALAIKAKTPTEADSVKTQ